MKHPGMNASFSSAKIDAHLPTSHKQAKFAEHELLKTLKMIDSTTLPSHFEVLPENNFMPRSDVDVSLPAGKHFTYQSTSVKIQFKYGSDGHYHVWYAPE